mgnify:CR=1 FL=1
MVRNDYHVIAAKILKYLYESLKADETVDAESISPKELGINPDYWDYIMANLSESGYVKGVVSKKMLRNTKTQIKVMYDRLQITPDGIAYLKENSLIAKSLDILSELNDFIDIAK